MPKTFSPAVEAALNDAADAPVVLTCDDRPNMVALAEATFDIMIEISGANREACLLRAIPRPSGPTIMLVLEENFDKLLRAFAEHGPATA